jgi:hypothetical protein
MRYIERTRGNAIRRLCPSARHLRKNSGEFLKENKNHAEPLEEWG